MPPKTAAPAAGTTTPVPPAKLHTFHRNARRGDVTAIASSLKVHGQYKPITVNLGTHTGRPNEVLAGNHTLMAFRELGEAGGDDPRWDNILVHWVDVDDDMCNRIVVADNQTAQLGDFDVEALAALIEDIGTDIDGLGFTEADIEELQRAAAEAANAGNEDPEDPNDDAGAKVALWGTTVGEPDVECPRGSVWKFGHHTLVVASVHKDWAVWGEHLNEGDLFAPYPSLLQPYTDRADATPMVMVQPDPYIAGWLITKWNRVYPDRPAVMQ